MKPCAINCRVLPLAALFPGLLAINAPAQSWTLLTGAPSKNWTSVVCSADGTKMAATIGTGGFYLSTNSGVTWSNNFFNGPLHVAISADGTKLAATAGGTVLISTNDGAEWQTNGPVGQDVDAIACSADGMKLVMTDSAGNGGHIFTSTDGGLSWATNALAGKNWSGVACSADGLKIIVVANSGGNIPTQVCSSTNGGGTWITNVINAPFQSWGCVASSADGAKLAAGLLGNGGTVYTSSDAGNTWVSNSLPQFTWNSLASSADVSRLIACSEGYGAIFTSTDSGATWVSNSVPKLEWYGVASSADAQKLVAVSFSGSIYKWQAMPSPQLDSSAGNGNLTLSWTVPSTNFVLQEAADLTAGDWTTLTNLPVLNLTNLQDEVNIVPSNGDGFFRLMAQ